MLVTLKMQVRRQSVWVCAVQDKEPFALYTAEQLCMRWVIRYNTRGGSATGFPVQPLDFYKLARWGMGVPHPYHVAPVCRRVGWKLFEMITIIVFRKGHALWNVFMKVLAAVRKSWSMLQFSAVGDITLVTVTPEDPTGTWNFFHFFENIAESEVLK